MILDIETYPNYNLFAFRSEVGELYTFESFDVFSKKDIKKIKKLLKKNTIITYNGSKYDIPLVDYAINKNATVFQMYQASKAIIEDKINMFALYKKFGIDYQERMVIDHIDIKEPSPAVMISLKLYGARLHTKTLWELPFDPHKKLTKKQCKTIKSYCENDLIVTQELYEAIKPRLDLRVKMRKEYGLDLRSKSDAQIAEAVMVSELDKVGVIAKRPSLKEDYRCQYKAPSYIKFKTPQLKKLLKTIESQHFGLNGGGSVQIPPALTQEIITIGDTDYKIGIGGLHSQEKSLTVITPMFNADFASYYPFIMIQNSYYPKHLGKEFIKIYEHIVTTRLKAKREGDKVVADSLKITINGLFGKLGSKWSKVYSPDLMLQVTLTGQLTLLMLIEQFEAKGIRVVSANTDGLEYTGKNAHKAEKIIHKLEKATGYEMEIGKYKSLHARDVNNYVACYDGYVKAKGVYSEPTLSKNPETPIVFKAIRDFLNESTPIEKTIRECKDIRQFLTSRTVKGGAMYSTDIPEIYPHDWEEKLNSKRGLTKKIIGERESLEADWVKDNGEYIGKVVRFYYGYDGKSIHYKTNGNKVPKSDGAVPMMNLKKKLPKDIDYEKYIRIAEDALEDLGVSA